MTQAFVYKWTHKPTGKWYIGSRTAKNCHINDGYICSSKVVKPMILESKDLWKRDILVIGEPEYIKDVEALLLVELDAKNNDKSFNRSNSGKPKSDNCTRMNNGKNNIFVRNDEVNDYELMGWKIGFTDNVKKRMKENHADVSGKNNPMYGTSRKGKLSTFYGRKHTEETKEKLRRPKLESTKQKISLANSGKNNGMFGKTQKKKFCCHCNKEIAVNSYARWHGNNCKIR